MKSHSLPIFLFFFLFFSCHNHPTGPSLTKASIEGQWETLTSTDNSNPIERHEAAFVKVGVQLILLGGRGIKPVNRYDIATKTWHQGSLPPLELHHFQPIVYQESIYIIGAFTGGWPAEKPVLDIYVYLSLIHI